METPNYLSAEIKLRSCWMRGWYFNSFFVVSKKSSSRCSSVARPNFYILRLTPARWSHVMFCLCAFIIAKSTTKRFSPDDSPGKTADGLREMIFFAFLKKVFITTLKDVLTQFPSNSLLSDAEHFHVINYQTRAERRSKRSKTRKQGQDPNAAQKWLTLIIDDRRLAGNRTAINPIEATTIKRNRISFDYLKH